MDLNDYLEMFLEESKEHLQAINEELLELEKEPENIGIINEIFRSAHTLKGMAASMGYEDLASLTHEMENILDLLRNSKLAVTAEILDVIFTCIDLIENMITGIEQGGDGKADVSAAVKQLSEIRDPAYFSKTEAFSASKEAAVTAELELVLDEYQSSIIREAHHVGSNVFQVTVTFDEQCLMKSVRAYMVFQTAEELGEIIMASPPVEQIEEENFDRSFTLLLLSDSDSGEIREKIAAIPEISGVIVSDSITAPTHEAVKPAETGVVRKEPANRLESQSREDSEAKKKTRSKSIRVDIEKLDQLMNLFSELIIDKGRLEQISRVSQNPALTETVEHMTRISTDLQGLILNMRMVPVEQVFNRFPRMVRDLAKDLNKQVQLLVEGAETELDRTVIDEIGDPLIHLLRNALDHGLESTEERAAGGKPEQGTILLKSYHSGNYVFIEVSDDGRGIDRAKVLKKAIERSVVSPEAADTLTDEEVYGLLFSSGFSTAEQISDISGRGVGLDVVKTKIESLGGVIAIESALGKGSIFRIRLPLTLSIIYSMLVKVEAETYAIPFNSIMEITTVSPEQVSSLYGQRVIEFRGHVVPLVYLNEVFQVPPSENTPDEDQLYIVIVRKGEKLAGLVVDSVLEQQEVVLKSLGGFLTNLYAISGATILGNGEVALIIDSNQFIK